MNQNLRISDPISPALLSAWDRNNQVSQGEEPTSNIFSTDGVSAHCALVPQRACARHFKHFEGGHGFLHGSRAVTALIGSPGEPPHTAPLSKLQVCIQFHLIRLNYPTHFTDGEN